MRKLFLFFISMLLNSALHGEDIIVPSIKEYIEKSSFYKASLATKTGHVSWNKDSSKCAWVTISDTSPGSDQKHLKLTVFGIDNNGSLVKCCGSWDNFHLSVFEDDIRPIFNKEGRVCFYGYGSIKCSEREDSFYKSSNLVRNIMEYSIDFDGNKECPYCYFVFTDKQYGFEACGRFVNLFNFPVLLQALIESKHVEKISDRPENDTKSFYVKGVTLPKNYKMYKKHVGLEQWRKKNDDYFIKATSEDLLPDIFREAIDERYEEQQEKNEHFIRSAQDEWIISSMETIR